ncbi:MAG: DUF6516 family protein [Patescibacteria group bacterium]
MYHLLDLLQHSAAVRRVQIIHFVDEEDVQLLHARAELTDDSVLFVRELATADDSKYAYHWQDARGALICRWDNAPHHRRMTTFPHHKHIGSKNRIEPSVGILLERVLAEIEKRISS